MPIIYIFPIPLQGAFAYNTRHIDSDDTTDHIFEYLVYEPGPGWHNYDKGTAEMFWVRCLASGYEFYHDGSELVTSRLLMQTSNTTMTR